jgi:hypothetical protein
MIFTRRAKSYFENRKISVCVEIYLLFNHCSFTVMIVKTLLVLLSNITNELQNR